MNPNRPASSKGIVSVGHIVTLTFHGHFKYVVGKVLHGGMGIVYQLVPVRSDLPTIALKTFQRPVQAQAFERECQAWLSVSRHPNIATAVAYGHWEDVPAISMDWYPKSMAELRFSDCSDEYILQLANGIIDALEFAQNEVGMIHQDVKPANILIDSDGNPRLTDFGLARCANACTQPLQTWEHADPGNRVTGPLGGTAYFMAPELFSGAKPSAKSDLFSLGVTLFTFITGEHPYFGPETQNRVAPDLRIHALNRVLSTRGSTLKPLADMIADWLKIDPTARPSFAQTRRPQPIEKDNDVVTEEFAAVTSIIGQAMLERERGNYTIAESILRHGLHSYNDEPAILNALGTLALKQRDKNAAATQFRLAFDVIAKTNGLHHGVPYLDPVMNLARVHLDFNRFDAAEEILGAAWEWTAGFPELPPNMPNAKHLYSEFGWLLLFRGLFTDAEKHLRRALNGKGDDLFTALWLTEAAWVNRSLSEHSAIIIQHLIKPASLNDSPSVLALCLAGQFSTPETEKRITSKLSSDSRTWLREIESDYGISCDGLLFPKNHRTQSIIVRSLDQIITGGKHLDLIQ